MVGRVAAFVAVVIIGVVAVVVLLGGSKPYRLDLRFSNASQLVKGDQVKIGGVAVGTVSGLDLAPDGEAQVDVKLKHDSQFPLHEGSTARIRISSLSGVANRFIALTPGPTSGRTLRSGATIDSTHTTSQVELDSVFSALDPSTRTQLKSALKGGAIAASEPDRANKGLHYLNPALSQTDAVVRELGRDRPAFSRFLVQTASVTQAVAARDTDLDRGLVGAATTANTLAARTQDISSILRDAPASLGELSKTTDDLRGTLDRLLPTVRRLRPIAPQTAALVSDAQPVLRDGPGALNSVDQLLPGLRVAMRRLPSLRDATLPAASATDKALDEAQPILDGLLPYVPDIYHGLITGFGEGAVQSYDANGQYARIEPTFDTLGLNGVLNNVINPPKAGTSTHNTARCPGAAYEPLPDKANAKVPDPKTCNPDQTPSP